MKRKGHCLGMHIIVAIFIVAFIFTLQHLFACLEIRQRNPYYVELKSGKVGKVISVRSSKHYPYYKIYTVIYFNEEKREFVKTNLTDEFISEKL